MSVRLWMVHQEELRAVRVLTYQRPVAYWPRQELQAVRVLTYQRPVAYWGGF